MTNDTLLSPAIDELTPREREILALMAEGHSNGTLCERLFLSPKTVGTHIAHIFLKLGLHPHTPGDRRVLAVLAYLTASSTPLAGGWQNHSEIFLADA